MRNLRSSNPNLYTPSLTHLTNNMSHKAADQGWTDILAVHGARSLLRSRLTKSGLLRNKTRYDMKAGCAYFTWKIQTHKAFLVFICGCSAVRWSRSICRSRIRIEQNLPSRTTKLHGFCYFGFSFPLTRSPPRLEHRVCSNPGGATCLVSNNDFSPLRVHSNLIVVLSWYSGESTIAETAQAMDNNDGTTQGRLGLPWQIGKVNKSRYTRAYTI